MLLADEHVTSLESAGEVFWAAADHLGSVRDVVDSSGTLRIHRVFDSYGNIVGETHYDEEGEEVESNEAGFVTVAFAFTGRYFDPHTSLQNNPNRWFDAVVGSWISEDPIGFAGDPSNVFRYVVNAPTMYVDPNGFAYIPPWTKPIQPKPLTGPFIVPPSPEGPLPWPPKTPADDIVITPPDNTGGSGIAGIAGIAGIGGGGIIDRLPPETFVQPKPKRKPKPPSGYDPYFCPDPNAPKPGRPFYEHPYWTNPWMWRPSAPPPPGANPGETW
jgi:RHS repeat-associated protein